MKELLATIKEVQEGGKHLANWYLSCGYVLLDIQGGARARHFPSVSASGQQYYVHRNPVYVLGRPEGVEAALPPPKWTPPKEDDNTDSAPLESPEGSV